MENNTIIDNKELYNALYKTLVNLNRSDVDANTILSELKEKDGKDLNRVLQTTIQNESNDDTKQKLNQLNKSLIEVLSMNLDNSQENKSLVSAFIKDAKVIADMLQMDYVGESSDPIRNDKPKRKPEPALVTTTEGYTIQEAFFLNRKNGNKRLLVPLMKLQTATKELVKKIDEKVATQKDIKRYLSISLFGNQEKQGLEIAKVIDILKDMTSEDGQNEFSDVYDTTQMNQLQDLANRLQKFNKECHDVAKTKGAIDLGNLSKSGKAVVQSLDQVKTFVSEINTNALQSKQKAKEEKEKDKKLPFFNKVDKAVTKFTGEDTPTAKASDIVKNDNPTVGIQIKESFEDDFDDEEIIQEGLFTTSKNVYNRMCYDLDVCLPYIKEIADKIVSGEITSPKQLKKAYCREVKVSNTIGDDLNGNISTYQTTEYGEKTLESYIGDLITHLKIAAKRLRTKKAFTEEERERVLKLFESVVQMRKDTIKCINGKTLFSEYNPNGIKNLGKLMNEVYTEGTSIRNYYAEKIGENPSKKDKKSKSKQNTTPSTKTPVETVETSEEGTKDAE
jgi:hypothetical protein